MCRNDFVFNNKVLRYSFIFFFAIAIYFLLPSDTYAVEIINPKIEIYGELDPQPGVIQNYDTLLAGCDACECLSSSYGQPKYVHVYIPKNTISSFYTYSIEHSFSWRTTAIADAWSVPPVLQFTKGTAINYTQTAWTNVYNQVVNSRNVRDNWFSGEFTAPYVNLLSDQVELVYNFTNYAAGMEKTPYDLEFCSWHIYLNTTGVNGDSQGNLGIVIDNSKNDIINNQNENFIKEQFADQERFDALTSDNVSSGISKFDEFISNFSFKDNGGISEIVTLPIELIRNVLIEANCIDLSFSIWGKDVYIPNGCSFWIRVPENYLSVYQLIVCGFLSYFIICSLFDDIHSLKDPNNLEVNTLDL